MLNFASSKSTGHDHVGSQILRYMTMCFSVLSEYLVNENERVRRAAFSAVRIIILHGIDKKFFAKPPVVKKAKT
jgi:hypothetical protein